MYKHFLFPLCVCKNDLPHLGRIHTAFDTWTVAQKVPHASVAFASGVGRVSERTDQIISSGHVLAVEDVRHYYHHVDIIFNYSNPIKTRTLAGKVSDNEGKRRRKVEREEETDIPSTT